MGVLRRRTAAPSAQGRPPRRRRPALRCCGRLMACWAILCAAGWGTWHLATPRSSLWTAMLLVRPGSGWALGRCLSALALGGVAREMDCMEAMAHLQAQALDLKGLAKHSVESSERWTPPAYVHFILTQPLRGSARDLAWCALEAAVDLCKQQPSQPPEVRLWVEHQPASTMSAIQRELHVRGLPVVVQSFSEDLLQAHRTGALTDPKLTRLEGLEEWILARLAHRSDFEAALWSDAYRVAILGRYGGLYLDLDMIPLDGRLLQLADGSLVLQDHKAVAYCINGGAIRLDQGHPFLRLLEDDWLRYGDYYKMVPRWGFLGPAQLTRAYIASGQGLTLYDAHLFEPRSVKTRPSAEWSECGYLDDSLTIHFSGKAKDKANMPELRSDCIASRLAGACPTVSATCVQAGWGTSL